MQPQHLREADAPFVDMGVVPIESRLRHQDDVEDVFKRQRERERQHELQNAAERTARDQPSIRAHKSEESENRSMRNVAVPEPLEEASLQRDIGIAVGRHPKSPYLRPNFSTSPDRCSIHRPKEKTPPAIEERNYREAVILTASQKRMKRHPVVGVIQLGCFQESRSDNFGELTNGRIREIRPSCD